MSQIRIKDLIAPSFYGLHHVFKNDVASEIWCKGGRGSTKSSFISIEILLGLMRDKNANALVLRRYDNELRDSVHGQLRWAANKLGVGHLWRFMTSPMKAEYIPTGQTIVFKGADDPTKIKSINLGDGYIKYLWAEEVDQFGGMAEIDNIIQSVFRGEDKNRISIYSYNPPKSARSWVNQETKIEKLSRVVHTSDYRSVPPEWLGKRFIADAEHKKLIKPDQYRHEYLGEEIGTGLEVFNNITLRKITDEEIRNFDQIRQGLDFGYAVDPVAFLRMNYSIKKRTLHIFHEVSGIGISNRVLAEKLTDEMKRIHTWCDKAEPKSRDELKEYGLRIDGADKAPGSVDHGTQWLADLEEIIIDPERCPLAASEYVNYALEVNRQGDTISRYPDKDNHCIDATRYGLVKDIAMRKPTVSARRIPGL